MATTNLNIDIHHLTRVEGHGNIVVNVTDGTIERCQWQVPEAPRFFEAMIVGRHYSEVARIVSRICGICAIGHTLASVKASEDALGITVTRQTQLLRRILKHAENFDSHVLHLYFLVAPDLLGAPSVMPLVPTHREIVLRALRMKRVGCDWGTLIGGRSTHPTKVVVGGFASLPGAAYTIAQATAELRGLKQQITGMLPDALETFNLLRDLSDRIPDFQRATEYVALSAPDAYALYDGPIGCQLPDGRRQSIPVSDYRTVTNEYLVPHSTAKFCRHQLESYMVGALARCNLNFEQLHPEARAIADGLGFTVPCHNPYFNPIAQFIECIHSAHSALDDLDELLECGIRDESPLPPTRFGHGTGAVEVPRGILFHDYEYDLDGLCQGGNCVIPTGQNHGNIQQDFEALVPQLLAADRTEPQIAQALEMLVRAYDPCISCSTHYLDIEFIK